MLHLTQSAIFQMRIDLSRKLLATPLKRLQTMGKHRLLVILTEDVHTFTAAFEWVPLLFVNAVVTLACFAYLAWLSWSLLLILALFLLVGLIAFHLAERGPLSHLERVRQQKDVLYQHFRSLIEGSKELQLSNARGEAFVERVIRPGADEFRVRFLRGMAGYSVVANLGTLLFYLNLGVLLFVVPFWLPQSITVLTSFTVTLLYLVRPISDLMIALPSLRQASIALSRIRQLDAELSTEAQMAAPVGNAFASQGPTRLLLNGVCHRYPGEHEDHPFLLGPIDLTLEQGELVFVVGGNGSGKTTLSMLLLGLYAPESGCVVLNGVEVDDDNREQYRQHFAAVFADFHLFEHLLGDDGLVPNSARPMRHATSRRWAWGTRSASSMIASPRWSFHRPAQTTGAGLSVSGRQTVLPVRRVGGRPGPGLQAGVLHGVVAGAQGLGQDRDCDHAR